jgi:hypothetical protein
MPCGEQLVDPKKRKKVPTKGKAAKQDKAKKKAGKKHGGKAKSKNRNKKSVGAGRNKKMSSQKVEVQGTVDVDHVIHAVSAAPFGAWYCAECGNVNWPHRSSCCNNTSCSREKEVSDAANRLDASGWAKYLAWQGNDATDLFRAEVGDGKVTEDREQEVEQRIMSRRVPVVFSGVDDEEERPSARKAVDDFCATHNITVHAFSDDRLSRRKVESLNPILDTDG